MTHDIEDNTELVLDSITVSFENKRVGVPSALDFLRSLPGDSQLTITMRREKSGGYSVFTATDTSLAATEIRRLYNGLLITSDKEQDGTSQSVNEREGRGNEDNT